MSITIHLSRERKKREMPAYASLLERLAAQLNAGQISAEEPEQDFFR